MKIKTLLRLTLAISFLFLIISPAISAFAQDGEIIESFDDESLPGWEHSEGVKVVDGVLLISPENFAVQFDDFPAISYQFDFKRSGPGIIIFRYAISEGKEYSLIIHDEAIHLELAQEGQPQFLGESPWDPVSNEWRKLEVKINPTGQQISLDGRLIITTEEEEILHSGGLGFWVDGQSVVEFDNLTRKTAAPVPGEPPEDPRPEQQDATVSETTDLSPVDEGNPGRLSVNDLITELTSSQANPTQLSTFLINLGLAVVLSYILSRVYIHWGSSLSNRRRFAANFILLTITTTFIILVVRSSVALSLGLVGALSIVRFRSAIKEPEELAYLFFAIAIGIGLGDNQRLITVIALAAAILVLGIMRLFRGRQADFNLHVSVGSAGAAKVDFESIVDTLKDNCSQMKLIRFDESDQAQEASFLVEFRDMKQLKEAKSALRALSDKLEISFLDNKGIW